MTTETKLWAILIPGPDDVWAMPSKDAAEDAANRHNEAIDAGGFADKWEMSPAAIAARVIEWPYDAESHAEALASGEAEVLSSNDLGIPDGAASALGLTPNDAAHRAEGSGGAESSTSKLQARNQDENSN